MKIIIEMPADGDDESVIFRLREMSDEMLQLIKKLKNDSPSLLFYNGNEVIRANVSAVYYFESVDERTCACFSKSVCEVKQKLYQLEELLGDSFMRVSKSVILNLDKVKSLSPALSGRYEAIIANGEKIIISRQYAAELKRRFGL
jgi:DNA-binding LytR/AlgR family response regulator